MSTNSNSDNRLEHKSNGTLHDGTQGKPDTTTQNNSKSSKQSSIIGGVVSFLSSGVSAAVGVGSENSNNSQDGNISGNNDNCNNGNDGNSGDDEHFESCIEISENKLGDLHDSDFAMDEHVWNGVNADLRAKLEGDIKRKKQNGKRKVSKRRREHENSDPKTKKSLTGEKKREKDNKQNNHNHNHNSNNSNNENNSGIINFGKGFNGKNSGLRRRGLKIILKSIQLGF